MNRIIVLGRLTKDPEFSKTSNEKDMVKFSIANNTGWGEYQKTNFFNCVMFGKRASTINEHFKKGSQILVEGKMEMNKHEGKIYYSIMITDFYFTGKKGKSEGPAEAPSDEADIPF